MLILYYWKNKWQPNLVFLPGKSHGQKSLAGCCPWSCKRIRHNLVTKFSSVAQSCLTLCDPMNCSTPGLPVHHQLGVHPDSRPSSQWCHPAISSSVVPFSSCPHFLLASGSFPMSQLFTWGGQSTGVSALASTKQDCNLIDITMVPEKLCHF